MANTGQSTCYQPIPSEMEEQGVEVSRTETGIISKVEATDTVSTDNLSTDNLSTDNLSTDNMCTEAVPTAEPTNNKMLNAITTNPLDGHVVISLVEEEHAIERQASDIYNTYYPLDNTPPNQEPQKQFARIRGFVQKVTDNFLTTIYEVEQRHKTQVQATISAAEQRHKAEISAAEQRHKDEIFGIEQKHKADMVTMTEEKHSAEQRHKAEILKMTEEHNYTKEVLQFKVKTLTDQEEQHIVQLKKMRDQLMAQDEEHMSMIKKMRDQEHGQATEMKKHIQSQDETNEELQYRVKALARQEQENLLEKKKMQEQVQNLQDRVKAYEEQEQKYTVELKKKYEQIQEEDEMHSVEMEKTREMHSVEMEKIREMHSLQLKKLRDQIELRDEEHSSEMKKMNDQIDMHDEMNEVLQHRVKTLQDQEQEHIITIKKANEKIKRLEETEAKVKAADDTIRSADERVRVMEGREDKVLALAKKAALKIKDLEIYKKKQTANAKTAVENIQTLKQMLLSKHNDMEGVKARALEEYDQLAQELSKVSNQRADLQASLDFARRQYKAERELRKGDQKKIYSLRKMIEQYDGGVESTWSDLSQALSEEESMNPLHVYRESTFSNEGEFDQVKDKVLQKIPEDIKLKYRQVGFFNTHDYHFPVLALGPFDVPSGELRDKWLEKATTSLGIYYYGRDDVSMAYDMIPAESFIPYEDGAEEDFHILPRDIMAKRMQGMELSPIELVFEEGIKRINEEARYPPYNRAHPLKDFEEFGSESHSIAQGSRQFRVEAGVEPAVMRSSFMEKLGTSSSSEHLIEELNKIQDKDLLDVSLKRSRRKKVSLSVDVDCDNASCVSKSSIDSASITDMTITSLEEQVHGFMNELAAASKKSSGAVLDTCHEEDTRENYDAVAPATASAESVPEARDDVSETRYESAPMPEPKPQLKPEPKLAPMHVSAVSKPEPTPVSKPAPKPESKPKSQKPPASSKPKAPAHTGSTSSKPKAPAHTGSSKPKAQGQVGSSKPKAQQQAQPSGLVQQRLMMFHGHPKPGSSKTVVPDSSAKDLMKMWQMKDGKNSKNPKQQQNNAPNFGKTLGPSDGKPSTPSSRSSSPMSVPGMPQHLPPMSSSSKPGKLPTRVASWNESEREQPAKSNKKVAAIQQKLTQQQQQSSHKKPTTRCVTIPKNILKKIEGGEELTDHERKILKGIQKFNHAKPNKQSTLNGEGDSKIVIVQKSSTVSAVTLDDEKQRVEVSKE